MKIKDFKVCDKNYKFAIFNGFDWDCIKRKSEAKFGLSCSYYEKDLET